ncbi:MAG: sirohydrochlorin chelatase [Limnothrix sp. RL_2_0]|nr:sirohydrochlorin chelatase [Limnothrix sp. RL_2_0]
MQRLSVVVVHGSYSEVYCQEFTALMAHVKMKLQQPVLGAYLECTDSSLTDEIGKFLLQHQGSETQYLQILPLFLSPGVHVREDIPEAIAVLQSQFPAVQIEVLDYLGAGGPLTPFLQPQFGQYPKAKNILLAHGSRRTGANQRIEALAQSLQAKAAYWATEPSLQDMVALVVEESISEVCVVPYFLFSGKIPAAIATQIQQLQQDYPQIKFHLGQPFGTQPDCVAAIAQILQS